MNVQPTLRFWNGMAMSAIVVMLLMLVYHVAVPMPTYRPQTQAKQKADNVLREQAYALEQEFAKRRVEIDSRVWTQSADAVGALSLDRVTNMARAHGLKLTAFRPQKPDEQGELTRLAYVMTLEGPYPSVQSMVKDLETPAHRLSVHMVQIASADEASDLVTATVGISAFVEKPKPSAADKETT